MPASDPVVFWDFDGTLARRTDLWPSALVDAMMRTDPSASLTVDQLRPHLGRGFPWHEPATVRAAQTPEAWWAAIHPVFEAAYAANGVDEVPARSAALLVASEFYRPDAWVVIDGAYEALLLTSDAGYRNVILSNHAPELPTLVDALGLGELIEQTITSAHVGAEKPNPAIFAFALERSGVTTAADAWMVGDNPIADVRGARTAGMRAILADGDYVDAAGLTVIRAAELIVSTPR